MSANEGEHDGVGGDPRGHEPGDATPHPPEAGDPGPSAGRAYAEAAGLGEATPPPGAPGGALALTGQNRSLPHNIEAEQALLGAILISNETVDRLGRLATEHFYDPVHGRLFDLIRKRIQSGQLATPVTLKAALAGDAGLQELGGARYLAKLVNAAPQLFNVKAFADIIYDLAILRRLAEIGEDIVGSALNTSDERQPDEQISAAEERLYKLAEFGRAESGFQSFRSALVTAVDTANAAYMRDGAMSGLSTGLRDVDGKLSGLHRSDLFIIAGRPSMGKTALVTNIAFNVAAAYREGEREDGTVGAVEGGVVAFFSLEMSAEQLAMRILAEQAEISGHKIRSGDMEEDEFRRLALKAQELVEAPLFIDDTPALRITDLAARARRLKRQKGLDLVIVDYLQLCRGSRTNNDNRVQEVSEITQGLKAIAKELDVPVIALSQLSRKVEERDDKRPQLADLRESGSIEQDADVVAFVFREAYYKEREEPPEKDVEAYQKWMQEMQEVYNVAELIIGKQRHGPIGTVRLFFDSNLTRFGDLARDDRDRRFE